MKCKFLFPGLAMAMSLTLVNCGGNKEKKEEEAPKKDSVVAEEPKEPAYEYTFKVEEVELSPRWVVSVGDSTTVDGLKDFFSKNFGVAGKSITWKKDDKREAPIGIYYDFAPDKKFYTKAAFFINDSTRKVKAPAKLEKIGGGKALKIVYMGDYMKMDKAYADLQAYAKEKGYASTNMQWEQYMNDPMTEKDTAKWQTDIYMPVMPAAGE